MKKRILAAFLTAAMSLTLLGGCGGSSDSGEAAATPADTQAADSAEGTPAEGDDTGSASGDISINLVLAARDEYVSIMEREAKAIAEEQGITITTQDAANDTAKQIQFVETARNNGDQAIIVHLVDPATAGEIVEKAGDMKVIFVNRFPTDPSIVKDNVSYIGSDENEAGRMQAEALAEYFEEKGQKDINYVLIQGILGQDSVIKRSESALQGLTDLGLNATEATAPVACDWDRAKALDKVSPMISSGLEFDCIISNNDAMAIGAAEALEAQGIDPSSIPIVGVDATPDGVQAVVEGKMLMTVLQDAKGQGKAMTMAVANMLSGKPLNEGTEYTLEEDNENVVWIAYEPVTKENAADYLSYYDN